MACYSKYFPAVFIHWLKYKYKIKYKVKNNIFWRELDCICGFCQRWQLNWNPLILPRILCAPLTHQTSPLQPPTFHHKKVEITARTPHKMCHPMCLCFSFTILVCRRVAQQHGAAVGHDEAGDPPGDDDEGPNKGDQAQSDAASLLENMNFYTSLTCSVCRMKRFLPWRRNWSLYVNQVNF